MAFIRFFLLVVLVHNTIGDESTSSLLQVQDGDLSKNRDASMTESAGPFIHDDSRNELQKKRSSFVALRGKKFPFGLPLFGLKRASAYIPVRGRRVNMDYEDADDFRTTGDKRASSFYVGRGKKNYQPFLQLYPMLDVGKTTMDGQFEFEPSYPDSRQQSPESSWGPVHESDDLVRKRAQAFFGARGKRSVI